MSSFLSLKLDCRWCNIIRIYIQSSYSCLLEYCSDNVATSDPKYLNLALSKLSFFNQLQDQRSLYPGLFTPIYSQIQFLINRPSCTQVPWIMFRIYNICIQLDQPTRRQRGPMKLKPGQHTLFFHSIMTSH